MPTVHDTAWPKPETWQEFEKMTRDAMALRWGSPNLQMNGRPGQTQQGVDIWGADYLGRQIGIQCKHTFGSLKIKTIMDEIDKVEKGETRIDTLYIATTSDFDTKLQKQLRVISETRSLAGRFVVGILFWKDIIGSLSMNPDILRSYYPSMSLPASESQEHERLIAALELGFYGGNLQEYVQLVHGEFGLMAQVDPDELTARLRVLEHRAAQLLPPPDASPLIDGLVSVREGCLAPKNDSSDWDVVTVHAKRVEQRISAASSLLPLEEGRMIDLGIALSAIYFKVFDWPQPDRQADLKRRVLAALPSSKDAIEDAFASASGMSSAEKWGIRIYSRVHRELVWS